MKKLSFLLVICLLTIIQAVYSQSPVWLIKHQTQFRFKLNAFTQQITNLPVTGPVSSLEAHNALFDASGNLVFRVLGKDIIASNGNVLHTLSTPGTNSLVLSTLIIPVPGGNCGEYYVLRGTTIRVNGLYSAGYVSATKVIIDSQGNVTIGQTQNLNFPDTTISFRFISLAVSKELNGERTLYAAMTKSANPNFDTNQLANIRVNNQGISLTSTFYETTVTGNQYESRSLAISPNGRYLAFIGQGLPFPGYFVTVIDLQNGNQAIHLTPPPLGSILSGSDVEFAENGHLYVTSTRGILVYNINSPSSYTIIPNSFTLHSNGSFSSIYYGHTLEVGPNLSTYVSHANGIDVINLGITGHSLSTNVIAITGPTMPEQVRKERIVWECNNNSGGGGGPIEEEPGLSVRVSKNISSVSELKLFPNPAINQVTIQASSEEKIQQISVLSISGKQVKQYNGSGNNNQTIQVANLPKGIYLLHIQTDKGVNRKKLMVK